MNKKIKIMGVGGGGGNVLNHIKKFTDENEIETIAVNSSITIEHTIAM